MDMFDFYADVFFAIIRNLTIWSVLLAGISILCGHQFGWGIKFKTINKSRGIALLELGTYAAGYITDDNRHFDNNGFIVIGPGEQSTSRRWLAQKFGGLLIYVTPWYKPAMYDSFNVKDDGFGDPKDPELVMLQEQRKEVKLEKVETKSGTAPGLTIGIRMRPADLEHFLTDSPTNVVDQTVGSVKTLLLKLFKVLTLEEIHALPATGPGSILERIGLVTGGQDELDRIHDCWGVEICSIGITDVEYSKADQEAQAQVQRQKWEAKGSATELVGAMLEIEAQRLGLPGADEARAELAAHDEARLNEIVRLANETLLERKLAQSGGHRTVRVKGLQGGGSGIEQLIATAVTLMQGLAQQTSAKGDKDKDKSKGGSKP